ncbi:MULTISPECIES: glycerophosphodiester phosphodiesterase family protein [unclassified Roseitalea]|uniref:glycerophosphodiester phosphodiesterase family protein n=1 Tax=unclassified Roseitalea TaxID=2639107 RepID=UPI00273FD16A|nr:MULTISPECIES: glycerophosphodiester phosphodiesterase family protein [unclassified Roseitalea]
MLRSLTLALCATTLAGSAMADVITDFSVQVGPRPLYLVDNMDDGELKQKLAACMTGPSSTSTWSIGHRGAPLLFPEHTVESNVAAARMGAGILECDVTFTKDKELVCRHAQNDLHTTTNILQTDLAETCVTPFTPASGDQAAQAECRTSEITLEQFMTLTPKMDAANGQATTVDEYVDATANWRTDLFSVQPATLMTHAESIELFKSLGAKFTPELKTPSVDMPFEGFSQQDYAQKLIDEYKAASVPASDVWPQSFNLEDVLYWIENEPEFGAQAVYLMDEYNIEGYSPMDPATWPNTMEELKSMGINYIAPPTWMLVTVADDGQMVPSALAEAAKEAGLNIITWTVERSGPLGEGGGWYYQSVADVTNNDGDVFNLLNVLHEDVGVAGVFSDWPGTTTFYANCFGLE